VIVRQGPLTPEERDVLNAVQRRLSDRRRELVTVLLGSSSYEADSGTAGPQGLGEQWLLEEDARGRGIRNAASGTVRSVTAEELVEAIMSAEKVIQFP
jgi:sulfur transfer complex TusBCD TusB component (DsrH family)